MNKEDAYTEITLILNKLPVYDADWVMRMIIGGEPIKNQKLPISTKLV